MRQGSKNLTVERSLPSVWEKQTASSRYDQQQMTAAASGAALALLGLRRGGVAGGLLAAAGGTIVARAAMGRHDLIHLQQWIDRLRAARADEDVVHEASDESFPASDSPAWTPTAGTARR